MMFMELIKINKLVRMYVHQARGVVLDRCKNGKSTPFFKKKNFVEFSSNYVINMDNKQNSVCT